MLPVLIPPVVSLVLIRLILASRSSRARIKLLEEDEGNEQKLFHILRDVEEEMEAAVVDLIGDPADSSPTTSDSECSKELSLHRRRSGSMSKHKKQKPKPQQPILTPTQRQIVANLNKLNLKKDRAFIHPVRNSHAVIVCRDVKRFKVHEVGRGAIKHCADGFVL